MYILQASLYKLWVHFSGHRLSKVVWDLGSRDSQLFKCFATLNTTRMASLDATYANIYKVAILKKERKEKERKNPSI